MKKAYGIIRGLSSVIFFCEAACIILALFYPTYALMSVQQLLVCLFTNLLALTVIWFPREDSKAKTDHNDTKGTKQ